MTVDVVGNYLGTEGERGVKSLDSFMTVAGGRSSNTSGCVLLVKWGQTPHVEVLWTLTSPVSSTSDTYSPHQGLIHVHRILNAESNLALAQEQILVQSGNKTNEYSPL